VVTRVLDEIASDPALIAIITEAVRDGVPEISILGEDEVAEQVRLFVVSGLDAVAGHRPPTSLELDHVTTFAGIRARQRVPIMALLSSIHIGQHITLRTIADRLAELDPDFPPTAVMQAFVSHLRWAQAVESRIIAAHREAEIVAAREAHDQEVELLRALVEGPVLARHSEDLAARGFAADSELWVLRTQADGQLVRGVVDLGGAKLQARLADEHVMVTDEYKQRRHPSTEATVTVAVAGPVRPERLPDAYRLAGRVLAAAELHGCTGLHSVATVATEMVRSEHPEIGRALAREHFAGLNPSDEWAQVLVETFLVHMDTGQRLDATAAALFVHPNTIRHRLRRLEELTGVAPQSGMRERVKVWWAARAWLDKSQALTAARAQD
jgi:PucR-like helix-turn-helix protein